MVGLVTRQARSTASAVENQLEARDIQGLGLMAVAGATGVILAQEVTERVLPLLSMPREPSTAVQFAAAGAIKLGFAIAVGVAAASTSGIALVFLAFHAVGAVVFAGADLVNAAQRGLNMEAPRRSSAPTRDSSRGTGNAPTPRPGSRGGTSAWG